MTTSAHLTRLIVGKVDVSCIGVGVDVGAVARNTLDRTSFCDESRRFILGRNSPTFSVEAMFDNDGAAGTYWAEMTANHTNGTLLPVTVAPTGFADASGVWLADAYQMGYKPTVGADDAVDLGLEFEVTGTALFGQSLDEFGAITTTANGAAIDGGAASTNGGFAHLHVTAVAGTTPTLDVVIEHSVNGSTLWATLATFTQATTTTTTQRLTIAAGASVRRYVRAVYTVAGTGSPSYTTAVAFARA